MTTDQTQNQPLHLRVFLASPGDVADERALALKVLDRLPYDPLLRGRVTLEVVAWDKPGAGAPMLVTMTPQEAIAEGLPKPSECAIVIVIFWSRMGTPLPADKYRKPDGSPYRSGTEWEFCDALAAAEASDSPKILVYRRMEEPRLGLSDPDLDEKRRQWRLVQEFFESFRNPDGSIHQSHNEYATADDFEKALENHLKAVLKKLIESPPPEPSRSQETPSAPEPEFWQGSPFPGLRAFTPDDAPIFFGRSREIEGLIRRLADSANRFLAVVGASGSGKSSLVAAGLWPRLKDNAIAGSKDWEWLRFTPGEVGDNPFMALVVRCADRLQKHGRKPWELAEALANDPGALDELVDMALKDKPEWAELLLFIDQFEELFTLTGEDYRQPFIELLEKAAQTERVRTIVTVRADFYHRCVAWPPLAELLRTGSYPLAAPQPWALHEMITRPAERAGLGFENGLPERILEDTGLEPGALALMAFALAELYERRTAEGLLTDAAYRKFKGVQGAIGQRAEAAFQKLGSAERVALSRVFRELVEVDAQGTATRRRAPLDRVAESAEAAALVEAFTEARLLVRSRGEADRPTVEVAHEALLASWPRLNQWIERNAAALRARQDLERAAREWVEAGKPKWSGLASGGILKRYRQVPSPPGLSGDFLRACWRLAWWRRSLAVAGISIITVIAAATVWLYASGLTVKHGAAMVLSAVGLYPVDEPEMVEIPPGEFWMGSRVDDPEAYQDEMPRHQVRFTQPFAIGKYEVTFDEYEQFAHATGRPLPSDQGWGKGRRPVINVSWEEARAYADWLSRKTGKRYRLPTEAEWEYAARAGTEWARFWGDDPAPACRYANVADQSYARLYLADIHNCDDGFVFTAEVGSFQANMFELHDMLGNVWEWVQDCWDDNYEDAPSDGSAWETGGDCAPRALRGGSWYSHPRYLRSATRYGYDPDSRGTTLGFRLARTL